MIQINLFPVRQIKQRLKAQSEVIGFVIAILVLLVLLGGVAITMSKTLSSVQDDIKKLEKTKADNQHIIAQIEKMKQAKASLETKLEVIKSLRQDSQVAVRVLDELARINPTDRLWLLSLSQQEASLRLSGVALDNATIAAYMNELKTSPFFASAELGKSSLQVIAGRKLKAFTLTLAITTPSAAPEETDSDQTGEQ